MELKTRKFGLSYNFLVKWLFRPGAFVISRIVSRSSFLIDILKTKKPFGWKSILIRIPVPKERSVSVVDSITFDFDFSNPLQKLVYFQAFEREDLLQVASLVKPGDCCLDIGANFGVYSFYLAKSAGASGKVFSFEPRPEIFEKLKKNVQLNPNLPVVPISMGVSSENSEKEFFVDPNNSDTGCVGYEEGKVSIGKCSFITLDTFVEQNKLTKIRMMKVDIEGHELDLVKGAHSVLSRQIIEYILVEFASDIWWPKGVTIEFFMGMFTQYGYKHILSKDYLLYMRGELREMDQTVNLLFQSSESAI